MSKAKANKKESKKGVNIVLYRNCKTKWLSESFVQQPSILNVNTPSNDTLAHDLSIRQWLDSHCPDSLLNNSLHIKDSIGLDHSVGYLQSLVASVQPIVSTVEPIDLSSIEDIKTLKSNRKSEESVFETYHGFDFDIYLNAGGPIWSTAFAPDDGIVNDDEQSSTAPYEKFLAVGLSRIGWSVKSPSVPTVDGSNGVGADVQRELGQRDTSDNLLQLWHLSGSVMIHKQPVRYKVFKQGSGNAKGRPKGSFKKKGNKATATGRKKKVKIEDDFEEEDEEEVEEEGSDGEEEFDEDILGSDSSEGDDDHAEEAGEGQVEEVLEDMKSNKKRKAAGRPQGKPSASNTASTLWPLSVDAATAAAAALTAAANSAVSAASHASSVAAAATAVTPARTSADDKPVKSLLDDYFDPVEDPVDLDADLTPTPPTLQLSYGVHLQNRGPVWQMSWCPTSLSNASSPGALGVLAVVCGDGSCLVLVLPRVAAPDSQDLNEVPVLSESSVCRVVLSLPGDMVTSICWNPHKPFELLCGMITGVIGVYSLSSHLTGSNIATSSSSSSSSAVASIPIQLNTPDSMFYDPEVDSSIPTFGAITSLQVCPHQPNLLLSGGCDGCLKIWDMHRPFLPLFTRQRNAKITQVEWDPCGVGFYYTDQSSPNISWDRLWCDMDKCRNALSPHTYKYCGVWGMRSFVSDKHTYLVSVASDGSVRTVYTSIAGTTKPSPQEMGVELFRIESHEPDSSQNSLSTSSNSALTVSRERLCAYMPGPLDAVVPVNAVAIHAVDVSLLMNDQLVDTRQSGCYHVVAYGGASGLLRVHSVNPLKLTLRGRK